MTFYKAGIKQTEKYWLKGIPFSFLPAFGLDLFNLFLRKHDVINFDLVAKLDHTHIK